MIKAILLDIEGTTTPIDFVHQTLFPFAKAGISAFVRENFNEIQTEIAQLKTESEKESVYKNGFDEASPESIAGYLHFLMEVDRKSTPLKSLQGKIWQTGYESGELKSEVFADVPPTFARWKAQNKRIAIYSSGSVLAQKVLFRYTERGDLTEFIDGYFDTNTGGKKEVASYQNIARKLDFKAEEILFVSDVLAELDAARTAGLQTALCVRKGNAPVEDDTTHRIIESFDELE
jgi:enolase-phosphatase E1